MLRVFFVKLLLRIVSWFSLPTIHMLGGITGRILNSYANELSKVASRNVQLCFPDLSREERKKLIRDSLMETGKSVFECAALWLWPKDRVVGLVKQVSGWELLDEAAARGKGVILAVPHLGSWEVMGNYVPAYFKMNALYRPQRTPALNRLIIAARERTGVKLAPTSPSGIRSLYKALAQGELIFILPDQEPGREAGVFAPFFGIQANTMTLISRLARKSGATVLIGYAERLPGGKGYHIHISSGPECLVDKDVSVAAACLNNAMEECARKLPAQYQWAYRRFKTRPDGEDRLYTRVSLRDSFDE